MNYNLWYVSMAATLYFWKFSKVCFSSSCATVLLTTCNVPTEQYSKSHAPPPGEKQSGEQSWISWVCYPKVVRTNEIARSVIIRSTSLTTISPLEYPHLFERVCCKIFLGWHSRKSVIGPRNLTRPFLLLRGWGLGTTRTDTAWRHQFFTPLFTL